MISLFSQWSGHFAYKNEKIPRIDVVVTFIEKPDNSFAGVATESILTLPDTFANAVDIKGAQKTTGWGSSLSDIRNGKIHIEDPKPIGQKITFIKEGEQISGKPILCEAIYNQDMGIIYGNWSVPIGRVRSNTPINLRTGYFVLHRGGSDIKTEETAPLLPDLIPA